MIEKQHLLGFQPECFICLLRRVYEGIKLSPADPQKKLMAMGQVAMRLSRHPIGAGLDMDLMNWLRTVDDGIIGEAALWNRMKQECNQVAMQLYPSLKEKISNEDDPLLSATVIACAGNIMDILTAVTGSTKVIRDFSGISLASIQEAVNNALREGFAYADYEIFTDVLAASKRIVYIGDNAGEVVFDRVVLEQMQDREITYVVKGAACWNDATADDAQFAGIDGIANVVGTEEEYPLQIAESRSRKLTKALDDADMIISKGVLNYNFLSHRLQRPAFYIFTVKCHALKEFLGSKGDIVIGDNVLIMQ